MDALFDDALAFKAKLGGGKWERSVIMRFRGV